MPRKKDGEVDHHKALTGDDLLDFVNGKLFPYLAKFRTAAESSDTIQYKIGAIFSEIKNRLQSGYNLREVLNLVDELRFQTSTEKHEMSHLYESKIKNMGNAGASTNFFFAPDDARIPHSCDAVVLQRTCVPESCTAQVNHAYRFCL